MLAKIRRLGIEKTVLWLFAFQIRTGMNKRIYTVNLLQALFLQACSFLKINFNIIFMSDFPQVLSCLLVLQVKACLHISSSP
jgi:hypothetical protein